MYNAAEFSLFLPMRHSSLLSLLGASALLLLPVLSHAATLTNGMAASDALGQYDDSLTNPQPVYTKGAANNGANRFGLDFSTSGGTSDATVDESHHRLFLCDPTNNRILVYSLNADDTLPDRIPDYVLGQSNFYTNTATTTQSGLRGPRGLAYDSTTNRFFVSDYFNNRVLVFSVSNITNGMNSTNVLGQSSFTASGVTLTQSSAYIPQALDIDTTNQRLFVSELGNHRVTIYSLSGGITNGMNASYVLGQPDFVTRTIAAPATQASLYSPEGGVTFDSNHNRLFVDDNGHNRILVYDFSSGITNNMSGSYVLGQPTFTASSSAITQRGMNSPRGVAYDNVHNRLFVADRTNNRVLVFTGSNLVNGMSGANVLGQASFTTNIGAVTQAGGSQPNCVTYDATANRLYVCMNGMNSLRVFDVASITNGMAASDALGQYDDSLTNPQPVYTKSAANNGPNILGMNAPRFSAIDYVHHRLFTSERSGNRVLVFNLNADDTLNSHIPSYVLGQPDFHSGAGALTQAGLNGPQSLAYDSTHDRLFVCDYNQNRVLAFDFSSGISNGMNATYVLGQTNFTSNAGATTQAGMNRPIGVAYDTTSQRLYVAELNNNRVMVFSGSILATGMSGSLVLGQSNFTTATANTTQAGLSGPYNISVDATHNRLFVTDDTNNRIMVWNISTITNGMSGAYVLGQADFTHATAATTQNGFSAPVGNAYDAATNRLFVGELTNSRILVFNLNSIASGMNAANVLGQSSFTSGTVGTTQATVNQIFGVTFNATVHQLIAGDTTNNRLLLYDLRPETATALTSSQSTDGNTLTLTATVTPTPLTAGSVTFADNGSSLGSVSVTNGVASLDLPAFSYTAGTHSITATFSANAYLPSTSSAITPVIRSATTTTTTTTGGGGGGSHRIIPAITTFSSATSQRYSSSARSIRSSVSSSANSSYSSKSSLSSNSSIRFTTVNVHLRSLATIKSKAKTQITPNTSITLLEVLTDWAKVQTKEGKIGYVLRKYLRK